MSCINKLARIEATAREYLLKKNLPKTQEEFKELLLWLVEVCEE